MILKKHKNTFWLLVAALVLSSAVVFADDDDVEAEEQDSKEKFVPIKFTQPKLAEGSPLPYLFDYFPAGSRIGKKWVKSTAKKDGVDSDIAKYNGEWDIGAPTNVAIEGDLGLIVKTKARHHAITAKLDRSFNFDKESLVVQYDVKFEEGQECGGGYLKLLSEGAEKDLASVQDKTPYTIMFGPDKCGASGKVHLIFRYKNPKNGSVDEYHAKQPSNLGTTYWDDHNTHLYTLIVKPNGDFAVNVDSKSVFYGNMLNDVVPSLTPPKQIFDPADKKPEDWDDRAEIEDVTASKPEDWDENQPKEVVDESATKPSDWLEDEPELIPDPEATKPADWDAEIDGEWEPASIDNPSCKGISGCGAWKPPTIPNPKYKGKWIRPKIANPAYKGVWSARLIDNPDYFEPTPFGGLAPISAVGIELWTMSENIFFDDILVTSSEEQAADIAAQTFEVKRREEARLASSKGEANGIVQKIIDAANERPWLWAVYGLAVIIPLVLIGVFCFGRKSSAADTLHPKKTDAFTSDDEVPNLVEDDEEEEEEAGEQVEEAAPTEVTDEIIAAKMAELERNEARESGSEESEDGEKNDEEKTEESHTEPENEPVQPTEEVAKEKKSPSSSGPKRRTARRGD